MSSITLFISSNSGISLQEVRKEVGLSPDSVCRGSTELQWHQGRFHWTNHADFSDFIAMLPCCHVHQSCSRCHAVPVCAGWTCDVLSNPAEIGRVMQSASESNLISHSICRVKFIEFYLEFILNLIHKISKLWQIMTDTVDTTLKPLGPEPETPCRTARQKPGDLSER